jgi:para-nitrobenzyl esterase
VPLIVGTNADEGRLFTRFLRLLPTTEPVIEELLADTVLLRGNPARRRFRLWVGRLADCRGPRQQCACLPLSLRLRATAIALVWGATHATELLAVFDIYRTKFGALLTAAADRHAALRVSNEIQGRWRSFSRTGVSGDGWPAHTNADRAVMVFDRRCRVEFDPHPERRMAWEGFSLVSER